MPKDIFQQSLTWALAMSDEQKKQRTRIKQENKHKGHETVPLDYSFLDREDF